jgi:hypothetical protein
MGFVFINYCLQNRETKSYIYENSKASCSSQSVIRSCCMAQTLLMQKTSERKSGWKEKNLPPINNDHCNDYQDDDHNNYDDL